MTKYFRVKALYPKNNMEIVVDSYGKFEYLWQLSAALISKGFKILQVWDDGKLSDSDIPKIEQIDTAHILIRACKEAML